MKAFVLAVLVLLPFALRAQQTSTPLVSLAGIGAIKIGMKKAELDRLVGKPITVKNVLKEEWSQDTVQVLLDSIAYEVVFDRSYEEKDKGSIIVYAVSAADAQLKTRSGIGLGDDKLKIVTIYDGYTLHLLPEYRGDPPQKTANRATVYLYSETTPTCIIFYLENNRVTRFTVQYSEGC